MEECPKSLRVIGGVYITLALQRANLAIKDKLNLAHIDDLTELQFGGG